MKNYTKIKTSLEKHLSSLKELNELNVVTNKKDFTSQIGEWLVAELYNGKRATSGIQKDWDIETEFGYIQVKSHSKSITTSARWSPIKYNINAQINELIIVVFTPDYKLKEFYKVPWKMALSLIKRQKHRDVINWDHLTDYRIEINQIPKQELVELFK